MPVGCGGSRLKVSVSGRQRVQGLACSAENRRGILLGAGLLLSGAAACSPADASLSAATLEASYDRWAESYEDLDGGPLASALGFPALRRELLAAAHGEVLEVGVGTGLNLGFYSRPSVAHLTGLDLSPGMLAQAGRKAAALGWQDVTLRQGDVAALPFPDDAFDTVVDTFSLCVFPAPGAALREMGRVLRPGGSLLLLEHSRSEMPLLGAYQDVTAPAVAAVGGKGCLYNQDVRRLVAGAGLREVRRSSHLGGVVSLLVATTA